MKKFLSTVLAAAIILSCVCMMNFTGAVSAQDAAASFTLPPDDLPGPEGWVEENGSWYFFENGNKVKNTWKMDSQGWCYLRADGSMATNQWIMDSVGWCYVGKDGYCVTNSWVADSHGWC